MTSPLRTLAPIQCYVWMYKYRHDSLRGRMKRHLKTGMCRILRTDANCGWLVEFTGDAAANERYIREQRKQYELRKAERRAS